MIFATFVIPNGRIGTLPEQKFHPTNRKKCQVSPDGDTFRAVGFFD